MIDQKHDLGFFFINFLRYEIRSFFLIGKFSAGIELNFGH